MDAFGFWGQAAERQILLWRSRHNENFLKLTESMDYTRAHGVVGYHACLASYKTCLVVQAVPGSILGVSTRVHVPENNFLSPNNHVHTFPELSVFYLTISFPLSS